MIDDKVSVRIEHKHTCGQVFDYVYHLKMDDRLSLDLSMQPLTMPEFNPNVPFTLPIDPEPYRKLELVGYIASVTVNGMQIKDNKIVCLTCGGDLLFPYAKEQ